MNEKEYSLKTEIITQDHINTFGTEEKRSELFWLKRSNGKILITFLDKNGQLIFKIRDDIEDITELFEETEYDQIVQTKLQRKDLRSLDFNYFKKENFSIIAGISQNYYAKVWILKLDHSKNKNSNDQNQILFYSGAERQKLRILDFDLMKNRILLVTKISSGECNISEYELPEIKKKQNEDEESLHGKILFKMGSENFELLELEDVTLYLGFYGKEIIEIARYSPQVKNFIGDFKYKRLKDLNLALSSASCSKIEKNRGRCLLNTIGAICIVLDIGVVVNKRGSMIEFNWYSIVREKLVKNKKEHVLISKIDKNIVTLMLREQKNQFCRVLFYDVGDINQKLVYSFYSEIVECNLKLKSFLLLNKGEVGSGVIKKENEKKVKSVSFFNGDNKLKTVRFPIKRKWNLVRKGEKWPRVIRIEGIKGESMVDIDDLMDHDDKTHKKNHKKRFKIYMALGILVFIVVCAILVVCLIFKFIRKNKRTSYYGSSYFRPITDNLESNSEFD